MTGLLRHQYDNPVSFGDEAVFYDPDKPSVAAESEVILWDYSRADRLQRPASGNGSRSRRRPGSIRPRVVRRRGGSRPPAGERRPSRLRRRVREAGGTARSRHGPCQLPNGMCFRRIRRQLELEAERIHRKDRRLAPGDELRAGPGFAARGIHQLGIFAGVAGRSDQRFRPGLHLAEDLDASLMADIGRDLIGDFRARSMPRVCRPPAKTFVEPTPETHRRGRR